MRSAAAQTASAVFAPCAPAADVTRVIGPKRGRAEETVPIEIIRDWRRFPGTRDWTRTAKDIPHVRLANLADSAFPDQLQRSPKRIGGHPLIALLRSHFVLVGELAECSSLAHVVSSGFFDKDVFAAPHRSCGNHSMRVDGRSDHQRVELSVHFVQHLAKVAVLGHGGIPLENVGRSLVVRVAQRHKILLQPRHDTHVIAAPLADTHHSDVQLLVRLVRSGRAGRTQDHRTHRRHGRAS